MLLVAAFVLFRWMFVLPGLLVVLFCLEYVARRTRHARALTALVAFVPMALWELTKSPGDFPSEQGAALGVTAVVFAALARLPARLRGRSTDLRPATQRPDGTVIAPR
jgi:hypothetical protein